MRHEEAPSIGCCMVNLFFFCWDIANRVVGWVIIAPEAINSTHLSICENTPFLPLNVSNHVDITSHKSLTLVTGFSAITHVQTSIPAAIATGVKTSNGMATKY